MEIKDSRGRYCVTDLVLGTSKDGELSDWSNPMGRQDIDRTNRVPAQADVDL